MSSEIHPTAIISPSAKIGSGCKIGPYAIVEAGAVIGDDCEIHSHAVIYGHARLGNQVKVHPGAVIGGDPQYLKFDPSSSTVAIIGDRVVLREFVTVHRGTLQGHGQTVIQEGAYLMAYTHVAHDCIIGKGVTIANSCQLAGHVSVGDYAVIGGVTAMVQHARVGCYGYVGGFSILRKDLVPFASGKGAEFEIQGINVVGLSRQGFSVETIARLKRLYKTFFLQNLTVAQAKDKILTELGNSDEVSVFLKFVESSRLGVHR